MKPILLAASLLLLSLSACPAAVPQAVEPSPQVSASFSVEPTPAPTVDPLLVTSETRDPNLPEILFPGIALRVIAGTGRFGHRDATALQARFRRPAGLTFNEAGELFVADAGNHCVRKITLTGEVLTLLCKQALADDPNIAVYEMLESPSSLTYYNQRLLIRDAYSLYDFDLNTRVLRPLMTNREPEEFFPFFYNAARFSVGGPADILIHNNTLFLTLDNKIQTLDLNTRQIKVIAGQDRLELESGTPPEDIDPFRNYADGPALQARFDGPVGLASLSPQEIVITDFWNHRIRLLNLEANTVTTLAGKEHGGYWDDLVPKIKGDIKDGPVNEAGLNQPASIAVDSKKNVWFSTGHFFSWQLPIEKQNNALRVVIKDQVVTIMKNYLFSDMTFFNNKLYFSSELTHRIYEMDLSSVNFGQLKPQTLREFFYWGPENELH